MPHCTLQEKDIHVKEFLNSRTDCKNDTNVISQACSSALYTVLGKLLLKVTSYILLATELFSYSYIILPIK